MSATFDLLRPDTFREIAKDKLIPGIWPIMDDRKFILEYKGPRSTHRALDRGCIALLPLKHNIFLSNLGMVVNMSKTEVMIMYSGKDPPLNPLEYGQHKSQWKTLGRYLESNLTTNWIGVTTSKT